MPATPTAADILALSMAAQNFAPATHDRKQSTFLSLAPTTMASSPVTTEVKPVPSKLASVTTPSITAADASPPAPATIDAELLKTRRSSSLSSDGSIVGAVAAKRRFLKLGEGDGDWSEDVLSEE